MEGGRMMYASAKRLEPGDGVLACKDFELGLEIQARKRTALVSRRVLCAENMQNTPCSQQESIVVATQVFYCPYSYSRESICTQSMVHRLAINHTVG